MTLREVCPRCGQSLYWCGESGVCVAKKVVFESSKRFHVEGSHDPATGWKFLYAYSDQAEAEASADDDVSWKHVRVVDMGVE